MKVKGILFALSLFCFLPAFTQRISPDKPSLAVTDFKLDSLPDSEIDLPIQINLKPVYALAETKVDTLFTSAGYPDGWIQSACDTRYKYEFRRSPLQMRASGTNFNLAFTGYYKIIGSTRVCVAGAAVSPWTPPCRCGFDEAPRRVNVSFSNSISIQPDYKVRLQIKRNEPQPVDKCEVCFWGQDITKQVLEGLKAELDAAKTEMDLNFSMVDLKPQFRQLWNQLSKPFNVYEMGWLQINPQRIRINNLYAKGDSLYLYLGLSARPSVSFQKPESKEVDVPNISSSGRKQGFSIFLDAALDYDSLSNILNKQLEGKEFDLEKGVVKKKFIFRDCQLYGEGNEKLVIKINFRGSNRGTFYLTGKPFYNKEKKTLELKDVDFDLKSRSVLLQTAEWLFSRKIIDEITESTKFDLSSYIDTAKVRISEQLNQEWVKGVSSEGKINDIQLMGLYPLGKSLVIRSNFTGDLAVKIESIDFSL